MNAPIRQMIRFIILSIAGLFVALGGNLTVTTLAPFAGQTNILIQATGTVQFTGGILNLPALPPGVATGHLSIVAGRDIVLQSSTAIIGGTGWSVSFLAGADPAHPGNPSSGLGNVTLTGSATLTATDGSVSVVAGQEVKLGTGFIHTTQGGSISVTAVAGSIDAGKSANGFIFHDDPSYPYSVDPNLGGISTIAGGDVFLTAGQDIVSYLPYGQILTDAGSGAFGPQPGNVTLKAGRSVYGHFVVCNGNGIIQADEDIGNPQRLVALSLVTGSWNLEAFQDVWLQEVRNPNGIFNSQGSGDSASRHRFDYSQDASLKISAGNSVQLMTAGMTRSRLELISPIYPPSLKLQAGLGGIKMDGDIILFPSPIAQLSLSTIGDFYSSDWIGNPSTLASYLVMSDSASNRYTNVNSFSASDHAPVPVHINDSQPATIQVGGDVRQISVVSPKPAIVSVNGNWIASSLYAQNLSSTDSTTLSVKGDILQPSSFVSVSVQSPPDLTLLSRSVDQPSGLTAAQANFLEAKLSYAPSLQIVSCFGVLSASERDALENLTIQDVDANGTPLFDNQGHLVTQVVTILDSVTADQLFVQSQSLNPDVIAQLIISGPGSLNILANSVDLGTSGGIQSIGPSDNTSLALFGAYGARIYLQTATNIQMASSSIASIAGGEILIQSGGALNIGRIPIPGIHSRLQGVFTTTHAPVSILAVGDISVQDSQIAAFDGGSLNVRSVKGSVDFQNTRSQKSPPADPFLVDDPYLVTRVQGNLLQPVQISDQFFSQTGLIATTFVDSTEHVGDITVVAGQNILFGCQSLFQIPLDGSENQFGTLSFEALGDIIVGSDDCPWWSTTFGSVTLRAGGFIGFQGDQSPNPQSATIDINAFVGTKINLRPPSAFNSSNSFQWYKDGAPLPSQTTEVLVLDIAQPTDDGLYSRETVGAVTTFQIQFRLRVIYPPQFNSTLSSDRQSIVFAIHNPNAGGVFKVPTDRLVVQSSADLVNWINASPSFSTNGVGDITFLRPLTGTSSPEFFRVLIQ